MYNRLNYRMVVLSLILVTIVVGPYVVRAQEGTATPETTENVISKTDLVAVCPNGDSQILYEQSSRLNDPRSSIYSMNADGSNQHQLMTGQRMNWSPDGTQIVYSANRDSGNQLFVASADGTDSHLLISDDSNSLDYPDWSPDGTRIAYVGHRLGSFGDTQIWVVNVDGSNQTKLTNQENLDPEWVDWSPDGTQLVFDANSGGDRDIFIINADGTSLRQLTDNDGVDDMVPVWSPDGTRIYFNSENGFLNFDIFSMNSDGTDIQNVSNTPLTFDFITSFSPDGRFIAFMSNRDLKGDNYELYVMNLDGTQIHRLTNDQRYQENARWQPCLGATLTTTNTQNSEDITNGPTTERAIPETGSITDFLESGAVHLWIFEGKEGQEFSLQMEVNEDAFDPVIEVLNPDASTYGISTGFSGEPAKMGPYALSQSGTYKVNVSSDDDVGSGTYTLTLILNDDSSLQTASDLNEPTADTAGSHWQMRLNHGLRFTFDLPEGFYPMGGLVDAYTNGENTIRLLTPDGDHLYDPKTSLQAYCQEYGYHEIVQSVQPWICRQGTYYLRVLDRPAYVGFNGVEQYVIGLKVSEQISEEFALRVASSIEPAHTENRELRRFDLGLILWEALERIRVNYVHIDKINWAHIEQQAIAMLDPDDRAPSFYRALNYVADELNSIPSAHKNGLWIPGEHNYVLDFLVSYEPGDKYAIVDFIYADSEGGRAGLRVNDAIESINGQDVDDINFDELELTDLAVTLRVIRGSQTLDIAYVLGPFNQTIPIVGRRVNDRIGYVETFTAKMDRREEYVQNAHEVFRAVDTPSTCGWILDLRRNRGGDMTPMSIALTPLRGTGDWWGEWTTYNQLSMYRYDDNASMSTIRMGNVYTSDRISVEDPYEVMRQNSPVAVLINSETASMGEMTAFIFQQRPDGAVQLFGEPTFGILPDGFLQFGLLNGTSFIVVSRLNVGPDGNFAPPFLEPDVFIETDYAVYGTDNDPVIQAATEWLLDQPECKSEIRYISGNQSANLRSGPGTEYQVVGTLEPGALIEVVGRNEAGDWLEIATENGTGWVADFLTTTTP